MASVIPNRKNGKIVSYKFKVCLGRSEFGKQINRYTTWHIPEGMPPSKAQKAAEKASVKWEQDIRDEFKRDLENPERVREKEIINARMEFSDFVKNVWFPLCIDDGEHKCTTIAFNKNISNVICTYFYGRAIQLITSVDIQKYLIFLRTKYKTAQGKPLAPKTIRHHYATLANIFTFAVKQEILLNNPIDKVDCPKLPKKKVDALSDAEAKLFFSLLPGCDIEFRSMLTLLITTGLRRGELMGLKWQDIDFENMIISVCRNVVYTPQSGIVVSTPKTDCSIRQIPMMPVTASVLTEYRDFLGKWDNISFLFPKSGEPLQARDPNAVTRKVKRFMVKNNLPNLSPHDLRHSCASLLLSTGADVKTVSEILGHADSATTLNFYCRTDVDRMRNATNRFATAFDL